MTFCGQPPAITNAEVIAPNQFYDDIAAYICNAGYESVLPKNLTCQADGTWTSEPSCTGMSSPVLNFSCYNNMLCIYFASLMRNLLWWLSENMCLAFSQSFKYVYTFELFVKTPSNCIFLYSHGFTWFHF